MRGNLSRYTQGESGWRMHALKLAVETQEAIDYSKANCTQESVIVWHPGHYIYPLFYWGGGEMFPSEVLRLEAMCEEIGRFSLKNAPTSLEQAANEKMLDLACEERLSFLKAIAKRGALCP